MNDLKEKHVIAPQSDLSDLWRRWGILYLLLQFVLLLVLVISHAVQTDVITDEIYSVLFQRILIILFELVKLIFV
jgi:hypothetical protein